VVEEQPEQIQIALAQVPPKKEIAPQAAIEVFDQGTASGRIVHRLDNGSQHVVMEFPPELPVQLVAPPPIG